MYFYYKILHTRLPLTKSNKKKTIDLYFVASIRVYVLKNSVLKRYCIFDGNEKDGFLEVFCKSTYRYSANILGGVLQNYWREFLKTLGGVCQYMISILLRYVLQKYWKSFLKHAKRLKITVKITEIFPAKILKSILWRRVLQNHQEESCRNVRSCSAKILKGVLQNWWG